MASNRWTHIKSRMHHHASLCINGWFDHHKHKNDIDNPVVSDEKQATVHVNSFLSNDAHDIGQSPSVDFATQHLDEYLAAKPRLDDPKTWDINNIDHICQYWPEYLINNRWDDTKYDLRLDDADVIKQTLKYWAKKCGLWDWLNDPNYINLPIPDTYATEAASEMKVNLHNLGAQNSQLISNVYVDVVMKDDNFLDILSPALHHQWSQYCYDHNSLDLTSLQEWNNFIDIYNTENWNINSVHHDHNKKGPSKIEPLSQPGDLWYPGSEYTWMEQYFRMINQIDTPEQINCYINKFKQGLIQCCNQSDREWIPKNHYHLYRLYRDASTINTVKTIRTQVMQKQGTNDTFVSVERLYTYDSFVNDFKLFFQSPVHCNAILGTIDQYHQIHKKNPIHRNRATRGRIHSAQWRLSQFALFRFLEKITFIIDHNQKLKLLWKTQMVTVGTFVKINHQCCGLITDIISKKWTFDMNREDDESYLQWHVRLLRYIEKFTTQPDTLSNEFLFPKYEFEYLPLIWKYQYCISPITHAHNLQNTYDSKQVWLDCSNLEPLATNLIRKTTISDQLMIYSLSVDGMMLFPDPNLSAVKINPNDKNTWYWNVVIDSHQAMSPFGHLQIVLLLRKLKDPFASIWVGKVDFQNPLQNVIAVPFQMNSDAFQIVKTSMSGHGKQSVKENFTCPVNHIFSNNLLSSFGLVLSGTNNVPFYTMFVKDVLYSLFVGHECELYSNQTKRIHLILIGMCNDGDEVRHVTGRLGASGNRPDHFNVLNKYSPMSNLLYQPYRHHKIMLTQSVLFHTSICVF